MVVFARIKKPRLITFAGFGLGFLWRMFGVLLEKEEENGRGESGQMKTREKSGN